MRDTLQVYRTSTNVHEDCGLGQINIVTRIDKQEEPIIFL